MSTKTIITRAKQLYKTHEEWTELNPILLQGEIAVVTVASNGDGVQNAPSLLFKVGDGVTPYNDLKFVSGLAADVYEWAKAATKPSYKADEIDGLADYISGEIQDTDTQYKIEKVAGTALTFKLFSRSGNSGAWDAGTEITLDAPSIALTTGGANGTVNFNGEDIAVKGLKSAAYTDSSEYDKAGAAAAVLGTNADTAGTKTVYGVDAKAQAAADAASEAKKVADDNAEAITAIKDGTTLDSFKDVESALAGKQAVGDYATKTEAQGYADAKDEAIAAAKAAADAAQADVDALEETVAGITHPEYTIAKTSEEDAETLTYQLMKDGAPVSGSVINIPKDMMVESGSVVEKDGKTYIQLVLNDTDKTVIEIDASKLIEYVTSGSSTGDMVVIDINADHEVTATITDGTITKAKLDASVQASLGKADTAIQDADLAAIAKTGNINDLVQTEGDILILDCGSAL